MEPVCPVFGKCGGCQFQHMSYAQELETKQQGLKECLALTALDLGVCAPMVASPLIYRYRSHMDFKVIRTKDKEIFFGFSPQGRNKIVPASQCDIALKPISDVMPHLRERIVNTLAAKYKTANLVVKTGDDGRVLWGGIGRGSLRLPKQDYLWTEVAGKRIFYSLDTFFQANLSILTVLMKHIEELQVLGPDVVFLDLYGGVGMFGIVFARQVRQVILVEENIQATKVAAHNAEYHNLTNFKIIAGRTEDHLPEILATQHEGKLTAMVDPPRQGLSPTALELISLSTKLNTVLYLSCNPASLARDLTVFLSRGWQCQKIMPFDFFPRTRHLEILAVLSPGT